MKIDESRCLYCADRKTSKQLYNGSCSECTGVIRASTYNWTPSQYRAQVRAQNGRCAICQADDYLVIDHDHKSGYVRGLLCASCNNGLGQFQDSTDVIQAAFDYLVRAKQAELTDRLIGFQEQNEQH
jgi:hypothetical protein